MEIRCEEDDMIKQLYEASVRGYVPTLNELIQNDPLILNKISLMSVGKSLLHISTSLGHLDFTIALLNYKPKLATKLDSHNRSALHFASAEGHTEIVKALLHVNKDVCLIADEEGRIPLHYAAMTGHIEVIQLLINKRPESIRMKADKEKTVLHLCVLYKHLEALKLLVEYLKDDSEFLNSKDHDGGNTILHLAVMLKQSETTKYLLSRPEVEENAKNRIGFTALDVIEQLIQEKKRKKEVIEQCSKDFKRLEIRNLLMMKGVGIADNQNDLPPLSLSPSLSSPSPTSIPIESEKPTPTTTFQSIAFLKVKIKNWIQRTSEWLEKTRDVLMLVATVITTTTFQSAVNPPGGVWQDDNTNSTIIGDYRCNKTKRCEAGMAVLAYKDPQHYFKFFVYNTLSFIASLCVIIVLVSGAPFHNKFSLWILTMGMSITLMSMGIAYLDAMWLVTPDTIRYEVLSVSSKSLETMIFCLLIFAGFSTLRIVTWLGHKLHKTSLKYRTCRPIIPTASPVK